eukprot:Gb_15522 [translate_table: standard]
MFLPKMGFRLKPLILQTTSNSLILTRVQLPPCFPMLALPPNLNVLGSLKLGKYSNWFNDVYSNEVSNTCERILSLIADTFGTETREIVLPEIEEMRAAHLVSIGSEALSSLYPDYEEGWRTKLSYDVRLNMALFESFSGANYVASQRLRLCVLHCNPLAVSPWFVDFHMIKKIDFDEENKG